MAAIGQEEVESAINNDTADENWTTMEADNSTAAAADTSIMNESLLNKSASHECPECQKAFKSKQTLKVHLNAEHYGKRISCRQCPKEFKYSHQLKMHVKKQHGDEEAGQGRKMQLHALN